MFGSDLMVQAEMCALRLSVISSMQRKPCMHHMVPCNRPGPRRHLSKGCQLGILHNNP